MAENKFYVYACLDPRIGKKRNKEARLNMSMTQINKNKELKIKKLYQSIINLIIRKEQALCGL